MTNRKINYLITGKTQSPSLALFFLKRKQWQNEWPNLCPKATPLVIGFDMKTIMIYLFLRVFSFQDIIKSQHYVPKPLWQRMCHSIPTSVDASNGSTFFGPMS